MTLTSAGLVLIVLAVAGLLLLKLLKEPPPRSLVSRSLSSPPIAVEELASQISSLLQTCLANQSIDRDLFSQWMSAQADILEHRFARQRAEAVTRRLQALKAAIDAGVAARFSYLEAQRTMEGFLKDIAKLKADTAAYAAHEKLIKEDPQAVYSYPLTEADSAQKADALEAQLRAKVAQRELTRLAEVTRDDDD